VTTRLFLDGKLLGGIDQDSVNRLRARLHIRPSASTSVAGEAIAKDASHALLTLPDYDRERNAEFEEPISNRLRVEIVYESLYGGEKFEASWPRTATATG
jgi:hypothetical protein